MSTVGYVGVDVPRELIEAAGLNPLRLAPTDGVDAAQADKILGRGVDQPTRLILAGLLADAYPIDFLVLCHDTEHTVRLHAALRALGRDVAFVDVLHLPREATFAYDRARLQDFALLLEQWSGRPLALEPAIAAANRTRDRVGELGALRRRGLVSSAEALALLREPHLSVTPVERTGKRVFLLGSGHDRPDVYEAIDELGGVVVGEEHAWGESEYAGRVDEHGDPLAALARHYQRRRTSSADGADVAIAWIREGDDALAWSLPRWRRELIVPFVAFERRPYRGDPRDNLRKVLA